MTIYYVLRSTYDNSWSFLGRNRTNLEAVRTDVLDYAKGLVNTKYYLELCTFNLGRLLHEFGFELFKTDKPVDEVDIQMSKRQVAKLTPTTPELEGFRSSIVDE